MRYEGAVNEEDKKIIPVNDVKALSINDFFNKLSQGLQFMDPRDLLRKLHFSENEIQEINQKIAEYCEQNNLDAGSILTASAADAELSTREIASGDEKKETGKRNDK